MIHTIKKNKVFLGYAGLVLLYALTSIFSPFDTETINRLGTDESTIRLLIITIIIPISLIWMLAFYGYSRINSYAESLKNHTDGHGFKLIAQGLLLLAVGLLLGGVTDSLLNIFLDDYREHESTIGVIKNYISVIFSLLTFTFIGRGASMLIGLLKIKNTEFNQHCWVTVGAFLSSLFTFLVLIRPEDGHKVYYVPDIIILITIVLPFSYAWYRGLLAAYHLAIYERRVKGSLYKKALWRLHTGIVAIVIASIMLQFLIAVSASLTYLNLTPLLLIIYVLVLVIGSGYLLIASGARNLQKIEEA